MAGVKFVSLVAALAVLVVCAMSAAQAAITCGQVSSSLAPCLGYLRSGGTPTAGCCNGVAQIASSAKTTADRKQACNCLKSAAAQVPGISAANAANLPGVCKVNIPYKISLNTNCNSIK